MGESIKEDRFPHFVREFMKITFTNEPYPKWVVNALSAVNVQLEENVQNLTTPVRNKSPTLDETFPSQRVKVDQEPSWSPVDDCIFIINL